MTMEQAKVWTKYTYEYGLQQCREYVRRSGPIGCKAPCGSIIERGDTYIATTTSHLGRWSRFEMHRGCYDEMLRQADGGFVGVPWMADTASDDGYAFDPMTKTWAPSERAPKRRMTHGEQWVWSRFQQKRHAVGWPAFRHWIDENELHGEAA